MSVFTCLKKDLRMLKRVSSAWKASDQRSWWTMEIDSKHTLKCHKNRDFAMHACICNLHIYMCVCRYKYAFIYIYICRYRYKYTGRYRYRYTIWYASIQFYFWIICRNTVYTSFFIIRICGCLSVKHCGCPVAPFSPHPLPAWSNL